MAKGKSSASSGTRKKHARKAAVAGGELDDPQFPKEKKQKKDKGSKRSKEPRKKVYIPPVKPVPVQPDPLDVLGIAQRIPAELLVVLRKLSKKDSVTKRRALEDFQADWVEKSRRDEDIAAILEDVLPVWLHHVPTLFIHPSRRVRQLAVNLHSTLLARPSLAKAITYLLHEGTSSDHADVILGTWLLATCDADRQVSGVAKPSWNLHITTRPSSSSSKVPLDSTTFGPLWEFVQRVLLDPSGIYLQINPPQPVLPISAPQSRKGSGKNTPIPKRNEETPVRIKDEEEESETDRKARLRMSGFGALEWMLAAQVQKGGDEAALTAFLKPLDNIALWSALYHGQHAHFLDDDFEAFGWGQPGVRRACWGAIQALLRIQNGRLYGLEQSISIAALRSAWVEPDVAVRSAFWQPLLTLLKDHPTAWELEARGSSDDHEAEDDSSSEDEETDAPKPTAQKSTGEQRIAHSHAYDEFRQFLELGCMGSPVEAYPAILVVLSTIPPSILTTVPQPIDTLFNSFWAAVDGRALGGLDRLAASAAFLSSLLECVVFFSRRLNGKQAQLVLSEDQGDGHEVAREFLREQIKRAWEEISSEKLKVTPDDTAKALAKTFVALQDVNEELFDQAWSTLSDAVKTQVITSQQGIPALVPSLLNGFRSHSTQDTKIKQANDRLINDVVYSSVLRFEEVLSQDESTAIDQTKLASLVAILDAFGDVIFSDEGLASAIDTTCNTHAYRLLTLCPDVLLVYLTHRSDEVLCAKLWRSVLAAIAKHEDTISTTLEPLLRAAEAGRLPAALKPAEEELEGVVGQLLVSGLSGKASGSHDLSLLRRVLENYVHFIHADRLRGIVNTAATTFAQHAQSSLREAEADSPSLAGLLELIQVAVKGDMLPLVRDAVTTILPDLFIFANVPPAISTTDRGDGQYELARGILEQCLAGLEDDVRQHVVSTLQQRLRDIILDCSIPIKPAHLLRTVSLHATSLDTSIIDGIFPSQPELDALLDALPGGPLHPSLAVHDPLILPSDYTEPTPADPPETDAFGYSPYARLGAALLHHLLADRAAARAHVWALRHLHALALYARDATSVRVPDAVFSAQAEREDLQELESSVERLSAYVLTSLVDEGWIGRVVPALTAGKTVEGDALAGLLAGLVRPRVDCARESRVLYAVLRPLLADVSQADADALLLLARAIEKTAPRASLALLAAVTHYAPAPPRLDRLRNEYAAALTGVPPARAATDGLWLLRRLRALAPEPESTTVFLPTPRAVNLVRACEGWAASDAELGEELEGAMAGVFVGLVPLVQSVPGRHWEFVWDLVESNLDNSSLGERETLPMLHSTLQLVLAIEESAAANRALRADWQPRRETIYTLIRDRAAEKLEGPLDAPQRTCRELLLTALQDAPETLLGRELLASMCHLLDDVGEQGPRLAYGVLRGAAARYTEHLVLEAGVDAEGAPIEVPKELVGLLQSGILEDEQRAFGGMLAWMLLFDLFVDASLKVKIEYTNHLRAASLIGDHFLPAIFTALGLYTGPARAFKLDIWAIDEFFLEHTDSPSALLTPLLAAHLYFRALRLVPGLVRAWLADTRDRALTSAVGAYTASYLSPLLIKSELASVRSLPLSEEGENEEGGFSVRVASGVNEVGAAYTVDEEHALELRLRLPAEWPLKPVDIRDTPARVGVGEERWRAWVLGVQQILGVRGGSVGDGLAYFRRNVSSHFKGQTECAICYSMISAMDGSLPKKPCKTCKNKFHAGCLYKWFNSSHSSSCPLCRSEIIQ